MGWLDALRARLAVLRGDRRDRELAEEIAHHLDSETARLRAGGMPPAAARRLAVERFGNPSHIAEATRRARGRTPPEGLMQDLRWTLRSLRRNPGFTALALVTIALGIGATSTAFAVLDTVLLRPLPYRDADRLVFLREVTATHAVNAPSHPNFLDWRAQARSVEGVASAMFPSPVTVWPAVQAEPLRVTLMGVSQDFFQILGAPLLLGREFSASENLPGGPPAVVVTQEFWQSALGGRQPLGSIRIGADLVPVVGVLAPHFSFVTPAALYSPHEQSPGTCRTCRNYMVIARLKPGNTLSDARTDLGTLSSRLLAQYGSETKAVSVNVESLRDYLVGDYRTLLGVVFGAAALVLLIACTNLVSAQLARGWAREREVQVRSALGASRGRLVRQLVLESSVLVAAGAALGVLLALGLTGLVRGVGAGLLPRLNEVRVDGRILGFVLAVMLGAALLVGLYPAWRMSAADAGSALRGTRGASNSVRTSAWRALLGFEIALAVVLSIGSTLLLRTFHNIVNADTGFAARGLVTAAINPAAGDTGRLEQARAVLAALPGADGAAYTTRLPLSWGSNSGPVRRRTDPAGPDWPAMAGFRMVSPNYFAVLRQPVLRGRGFSAADRAGSPPVAIITTGIAQTLWPGEDPVGKTIATNYLWDQWLTVVGVVAEASSWTMARGAQNEIYVPLEQHPTELAGQGQLVALIRATANPAPLTASVREALRRTLPESPALIGTMEERIVRSAADRRFAMVALTAFAAIALLLAGIGIYGVVWYIVERKTHEIGVRMALGATSAAVQRGVLAGAALTAGAGVVLGAAAALGAGRFLQATLYGVSRLDPTTYLLSAGVAVLAVLAGAWAPARRASRLDPLDAIRTDG